MVKTIEQYEKELNERPLCSIRDYIEKDIAPSIDPSMREIDDVFLIDGTSLSGKSLAYCFPEVLMASDSILGTVTYVPYTSIVKVVGHSKT